MPGRIFHKRPVKANRPKKVVDSQKANPKLLNAPDGKEVLKLNKKIESPRSD